MYSDEVTQVEHYSWYLRSGTTEYASFRLETRARRNERYMNSKREPIPQFSSEDEEREFWATHDSSEYIDWSTAEKNPTLSRLKPSTRTVSIRLPESLIASLKTLANKRDVPYQSLVKIFLAEKVREETAQQHVQSELN
jgi:predicted DNA binding CopG/RHH family protein